MQPRTTRAKRSSQYLRGVISYNPSSPSQLYRLMTGKTGGNRRPTASPTNEVRALQSPTKPREQSVESSFVPPESPTSTLDFEGFTPRTPPPRDSEEFFSYEDDDDDAFNPSRRFVQSRRREIDIPGLEEIDQDYDGLYGLALSQHMIYSRPNDHFMSADEDEEESQPPGDTETDNANNLDEDGLVGLAFVG